MKVLFINANLYGHINPTLALVRKFTERGNTVDYFCSESFSGQVTENGAKWIGYDDKLNLFLKNYHPTDRHPFFMLLEYMLLYDETALPLILDILKKDHYDMIICDSYFGGTCILKYITDIPVVSSHSSFAMSRAPIPERMLRAGFHPQMDNCLRILKRICGTYKINEVSPEQFFISKGDLNIVYTTPSFNGDDGVNEHDYLFSGPSVERSYKTSDLNNFSAENKKIIYISLGSVNTDFIDFYKLCIFAFRDTDYYIYMSVGNKCDITQLGEIPANFSVKTFLPQLEILRAADAFITHAGFNSVNEALYFGVPMLALPLVNDQKMVADRLASMHLGIAENMNRLSPETLKNKIDLLIGNSEIKEQCMKMSAEMKEAADIGQTEKALEKYCEKLKAGQIKYAEK